MTKVKICCISSIKEAQLAISKGANCLGLVGHMPSGPGVISDELIAEIAAITPSHIETFLLLDMRKYFRYIRRRASPRPHPATVSRAIAVTGATSFPSRFPYRTPSETGLRRRT